MFEFEKLWFIEFLNHVLFAHPPPAWESQWEFNRHCIPDHPPCWRRGRKVYEMQFAPEYRSWVTDPHALETSFKAEESFGKWTVGFTAIWDHDVLISCSVLEGLCSAETKDPWSLEKASFLLLGLTPERPEAAFPRYVWIEKTLSMSLSIHWRFWNISAVEKMTNQAIIYGSDLGLCVLRYLGTGIRNLVTKEEKNRNFATRELMSQWYQGSL